MSTCLSDYALDRLVLNGDCPDGDLRHLQTCPTCQQRGEARRTQAEQFETMHADLFWKRVRAGYEQRRRRRRIVALALPGALAVACAVAVLVVRHDPSPSGSYVGAKGRSFVEIHCQRAGKTFALGSQDSVHTGDLLRFVPRPSSTTLRYVHIASIDGSGRYTSFYPADLRASSLPLPAPGEPLKGSIRLDSAPGPERIFFAFSSLPLPASTVQQAAQAQVADLLPATAIGGVESESGWIVLSKPAGSLERR